uniref:mediator of DNA damage checkpoint protein 1-like isoform X2 n=1 Tax=Styela clava TaxID=7725 RepID=UPI00193AC069|nr:mediator of DNA damage checkpoint protein 1-like isoform X2 [Styela clava]
MISILPKYLNFLDLKIVEYFLLNIMESDFLCTQAIDDDLDETHDDESQSSDEDARKEVATLKVLPNKKNGIPAIEFFIYNEENVVGRHTNCNISIPWSIALSKQHAVIEAVSDTCFVSDCGSSNNTRLNKVKLTPNVKYGLRDGDQLVFGDVQCTFVQKRDESTAESASGEPFTTHATTSKLPPTSSTPASNKTRILATDTPENLTYTSIHAKLDESSATIPESQPICADTPSTVNHRFQESVNGKATASTSSPLPIFNLDETIEKAQSNDGQITTSGGADLPANVSHVPASDASDDETDYHEDSDTDIEDNATIAAFTNQKGDLVSEDVYEADTIELTSGRSSQVSADTNDKNKDSVKLNIDNISDSDTEDEEMSMIKDLDTLQTQMFSIPSNKNKTSPCPEIDIPGPSSKAENPAGSTHSSDTDDEAILSVNLDSLASEGMEEEAGGVKDVEQDNNESNDDSSSPVMRDAFDDLCTQGFSGGASRNMEDTLGMMETQGFGANLVSEEDEDAEDEGMVDSMIFNMATQAFPGCMKSPKSATKLSAKERDVPKQEHMPDVGDSIIQDLGESTIPLEEDENMEISTKDRLDDSIQPNDSLLLQSSTISADENSGFSAAVIKNEQSGLSEVTIDTEPFDTIPLVTKEKNKPQNDSDDVTLPLVRSNETTVDASMYTELTLDPTSSVDQADSDGNENLLNRTLNASSNRESVACTATTNEANQKINKENSYNGDTIVPSTNVNVPDSENDDFLIPKENSKQNNNEGTILPEATLQINLPPKKDDSNESEIQSSFHKDQLLEEENIDDQETQVYDFDDLDATENDEIKGVSPSDKIEDNECETQVYEMDVDMSENIAASTSSEIGQQGTKSTDLQSSEAEPANVHSNVNLPSNVSKKYTNSDTDHTVFTSDQDIQGNSRDLSDSVVIDENKNVVKESFHLKRDYKDGSTNVEVENSTSLLIEEPVVDKNLVLHGRKMDSANCHSQQDNDEAMAATQSYICPSNSVLEKLSSVPIVMNKEECENDITPTQSHAIIQTTSFKSKNLENSEEIEPTQRYIKNNPSQKDDITEEKNINLHRIVKQNDQMETQSYVLQPSSYSDDINQESHSELYNVLHAVEDVGTKSAIKPVTTNNKTKPKISRRQNSRSASSTLTIDAPIEPVRKSRRTSRKDYASIAKGKEDNTETLSSLKEEKKTKKSLKSDSKKKTEMKATEKLSTSMTVSENTTLTSVEDDSSVNPKTRTTRKSQSKRTESKEKDEVILNNNEPENTENRKYSQDAIKSKTDSIEQPSPSLPVSENTASTEFTESISFVEPMTRTTRKSRSNTIKSKEKNDVILNNNSNEQSSTSSPVSENAAPTEFTESSSFMEPRTRTTKNSRSKINSKRSNEVLLNGNQLNSELVSIEKPSSSFSISEDAVVTEFTENSRSGNLKTESSKKGNEPNHSRTNENAQVKSSVANISTKSSRKTRNKVDEIKENINANLPTSSKVIKEKTTRATRIQNKVAGVVSENNIEDENGDIHIEEKEAPGCSNITEKDAFEAMTTKQTRNTRASKSHHMVDEVPSSSNRRISARAKKKQDDVTVKQERVTSNVTAESTTSSINLPPEPAASAKPVVGKRKRRKASMSSNSSTSTTSSATRSQRNSAKKVKSEASVDSDLQHAVAMALRPKKLKPKVMFTGVLDNVAEGIVVSLGGILVTDISECTHLVTDKMRRTIKFLCALTKGLHIVTLEWLRSSSQQQRFLPEEDFELKEDFQLPNGEFLQEKYKFKLGETLKKQERVNSHCFIISTFLLMRNVSPPPDQMHQVLLCAGAKILPRMPSSGREEITPNTVIIATP